MCLVLGSPRINASHRRTNPIWLLATALLFSVPAPMCLAGEKELSFREQFVGKYLNSRNNLQPNAIVEEITGGCIKGALSKDCEYSLTIAKLDKANLVLLTKHAMYDQVGRSDSIIVDVVKSKSADVFLPYTCRSLDKNLVVFGSGVTQQVGSSTWRLQPVTQAWRIDIGSHNLISISPKYIKCESGE